MAIYSKYQMIRVQHNLSEIMITLDIQPLSIVYNLYKKLSKMSEILNNTFKKVIEKLKGIKPDPDRKHGKKLNKQQVCQHPIFNAGQYQVTRSNIAKLNNQTFINVVFSQEKSLSELCSNCNDIGIYGCHDEIPSNIVKWQKIRKIGKGMTISGISEMAAHNCDIILVFEQEDNKLFSVIFNCIQRISIRFNSLEKIQNFIKKWEQFIWSKLPEFLLHFINKFTVKVSYIDGSYWATVNEIVYDMVKCFDWSTVRKNPYSQKDQELIEYYLRRFFVLDFIKLILYHKKINFSITPSLSDLRENNPSGGKSQQIIEIVESESSQYKNIVMLPQKIPLRKMCSEGMAPQKHSQTTVQRDQNQLQQIYKILYQ